MHRKDLSQLNVKHKLNFKGHPLKGVHYLEDNSRRDTSDFFNSRRDTSDFLNAQQEYSRL